MSSRTIARRGAVLALASAAVLAGCAPPGSPVPWDKATAPDAQTVVVSLWGAPWAYAPDNPCGADYAATVAEDPKAVTVTVYEHRSPGWEKALCPAMTRRREVTVTLTQPLDGRVLVDGATGEKRPLSP